ncbi:hypothetical protein [Streptomyces sp. OV198]|uniref:hypothetical protein n=1 Tax=Streptomyces sp. OV198 TaxID=1882787 RepID=UPI00117C2775|nr:hypothetical protein [Streptomyces sp. OV198]
MTAISLEALDAVPWNRLESALPQHPVEGVPRALRRLALGGGVVTKEHCYSLSFCLAAGNGRVPSAATAALPFLVALAADPGTLADGVVPLLERWRAERTRRCVCRCCCSWDEWPPRRRKRMPGRSRRYGRCSTAFCVTASPS